MYCCKFIRVESVIEKRMLGQIPSINIDNASNTRTVDSLISIGLSFETAMFVTSPQMVRLTSHRVYAAPSTSVVAAKIATQGFTANDERITKNSPIKPEVPGNQIFANEKRTNKAANLGITLTTPPKSSIFLVCIRSYRTPIEKNKAPEISP